MHGLMRSDMGDGGHQDDMEEEELIEEDICDNGESPAVTANTKHNVGQKAKALFQVAQPPPVLNSTESDAF